MFVTVFTKSRVSLPQTVPHTHIRRGFSVTWGGLTIPHSKMASCSQMLRGCSKTTANTTSKYQQRYGIPNIVKQKKCHIFTTNVLQNIQSALPNTKVLHCAELKLARTEGGGRNTMRLIWLNINSYIKSVIKKIPPCVYLMLGYAVRNATYVHFNKLAAVPFQWSE
jgi:hypothetical protein